MMQNNPQMQQQKDIVWTKKANVKKIILKDIFMIIGALALLSIAVLSIHLFVGFDIFLLPLETFDIIINPIKALLGFIGVVAGASFLFLSGVYLASNKISYDFYKDKIEIYRNVLLLLTDSEEIPYANIARITCNKDGIFNSIFNSGNIILELTGMKKSKVEIKFLDDVEQTTQFIQSKMQEVAAAKQAQYEQGQRMSNILNKI